MIKKVFWTIRAMILDSVLAPKKACKNTKVALIKLDAIGDFLLWLHAAKALSEHYGGKNVVLIADECNRDIANQTDFWGSVLFINKQNFIKSTRYRAKMILALKGLQIGTAIHCSYSRSFEVGDSVVRSLGASARIGFLGDCSNMSPLKKWISDKWYTKLIATPETEIHEIAKHESFLRAIGLPNYSSGVIQFDASNHKSENGNFGEYFIVFPGASWEGRKWGDVEYSQLVRKLLMELKGNCLLCGGKEDVEFCNRIAENNGFNPRIINFAGKTSFMGFMELVQAATFLVGNESSCIHAAAITRTPAVCILGGGHFGRFVPYKKYEAGLYIDAAYFRMSCFGCNWICTEGYSKHGPVPCIASISVDDVFGKCLKARIQRGSLT